MPERYTNPLSLTSQFFFCGLPLRLDSYRGCSFQCSFCYARYRGGNAGGAAILPAAPGALERILAGALRRERRSGLIGQFLRRRVPVHFGGMSDPFQPLEPSLRVTRRFLETLRNFEYPTVISTRSEMPSTEPYLAILREMKSVVVQFSFTSTRAPASLKLEPFTPSPARLLRTMERLSDRNVTVTCRWQPYVPGVSESPRAFVRRVTVAGARHVALEHLKLPLETGHPLWSKLLAGAGRDLHADFVAAGARREGRELVLPGQVKLPTILETREAVHEAGASFGAADNEFQYISDTGCCCSGVDQFPGFQNWFRHQVAQAVRLCQGKDIAYGSISRFWTPDGSVDRWLNSNSRIGRGGGNGGSLRDHIRTRWNDPGSGLSPGSFFGVEPTTEFSAGGYRLFRWKDEVRRLLPGPMGRPDGQFSSTGCSNARHS